MSGAQWFYAIGQQQSGPVSWEQLQEMARTGRLSAAQLVWMAGMAEWAPAGTVPELMPAVALGYAPPPDWRTARIIKNAKVNCYTMFVVFVLSAGSTVLSIVMLATHAMPLNPGGCLIIPGGIFAAIYLPVRWQFIRQLHPTTRWLGLIGGFGLIGLLALSLLGAAIAFVFVP